MFIIFLIVGLFYYYAILIEMFNRDQLATKKEVKIALIPFGWFLYKAKQKYDKMSN